MEHYLDNAATTRPCKAAVEGAVRCLENHYGNPSSLHGKGLEAEHEMRAAREVIAGILGCKPAEIYFTSGATESNNLALLGAMAGAGKWRRKVVASAVEHASIKQSLLHLEHAGFEVVTVPPRADGRFYAADFLEQLDENTRLLSMMLINNENGYLFPVKEVFAAAKRRFPALLTHCDAVQGFLKIPFRVKSLDADLVSISAHKIHGVKGVGALYCREQVHLSPILFGGHQEKGLRPGTESVPLIAAFGAAAKALYPTIGARLEHVTLLRQNLLEGLEQMDGVLVRDIPGGSPYILNISLLGYRSETVLHYLEKLGIFVSSGSACSKGVSSGVLEQFGAGAREVDSALRISFCAENTLEDVDALLKGLWGAQKELVHV